MKKINVIIHTLFLCTASMLCGVEVYHRPLQKNDYQTPEVIWTVQKTNPFDELLASWSGKRPKKGFFKFEISIYSNNRWSAWVPYAEWNSTQQHLYGIQSSRDIPNFLKGKQASGFRVRLTAHQGASLKSIRAVHVTTTDNRTHSIASHIPLSSSLLLNVPKFSQIALEHVDSTRICSPIATAAAVSYLASSEQLNLIEFMKSVFEPRAQLYGAWVLNTAQAAHELDNGWYCYVTRLNSIQAIIDQLNRKYPVVVSIQGPIPGSARPYESGHLLVIRGYDAINKKVLCMDPAFPTNDETYVAYNVEDFLTAWRRRNGLAYIFTKKLTCKASIS